MSAKDEIIKFRVKSGTKSRIEDIAAKGGYDNLSEYMRDVVDFYILPVEPRYRHVVENSEKQPA